MGVKTISKLKKELDGWFSKYIRLGTAEELQLKARQPFKLMRIDYEEKISYYKGLVNKIKKEKSIE